MAVEARWTMGTLLVALVAFNAGCAGGSSSDVRNQPATQAPSLSIALQPAAPATVGMGVTLPITAVVSNDPNAAGVDWTVTCGGPDCGSFSSPHTGSGSPASYTPPMVLPALANEEPVTIRAYAAADHTKVATASIMVTGYPNALSGTYVLATSGVDLQGNPVERVGALVLDGKGNVMPGGEQTVSYTPSPSGACSDQSLPVPSFDSITGGSYFVGPDGRGTLTVNTSDKNLGNCGVETYSIAVVSQSEALITKMDFLGVTNSDGSPVSNKESSLGTLSLQTNPAALPQQGYAFVARGIGTDADGSLTPIAIGGILNANSANAGYPDSPDTSLLISGPGSQFDLVRDTNTPAEPPGVVNTNCPANPMNCVTGTVSLPDSLGKVTIQIAAMGWGNLKFDGYIVDATHIQLVESDVDPNVGLSNGSGFALTSGMAIGQGSATGTFKDATALNGEFVFGLLGQDLGGQSASGNTLAAAGMFSTQDGTTGTTGPCTTATTPTGTTEALISGFLDETQTTMPVMVNNGLEISLEFCATYTIDSTGSGRVTTSAFNFTPSLNGTGPNWVFYLTGTGEDASAPVLFLDADTEPTLYGFCTPMTIVMGVPVVGGGCPVIGGGMATGIAYPAANGAAPAANAPTFSGSYGVSFIQNSGGSIGSSATGAMVVDANRDTVFGTIDENAANQATLGTNGNLTDNFFSSPPLRGIAGVRLTGVPTIGNNLNSQAIVDYFPIDSKHGFFVETDGDGGRSTGVPPLTNAPLCVAIGCQPGSLTFAYYATRTPVCAGCQ